LVLGLTTDLQTMMMLLVTRRINGGTNGLDDRKHNLEMMKNYYHKIYLLVKVSIFNKTRIWITLNEMNS
jgi:hypothetical protein